MESSSPSRSPTATTRTTPEVGRVPTGRWSDGTARLRATGTDARWTVVWSHLAVTSDKLAIGPAASVYSTSAEAPHSAASTTLHANEEIFDTAGLHDTTANTESLVSPSRLPASVRRVQTPGR